MSFRNKRKILIIPIGNDNKVYIYNNFNKKYYQLLPIITNLKSIGNDNKVLKNTKYFSKNTNLPIF